MTYWLRKTQRLELGVVGAHHALTDHPDLHRGLLGDELVAHVVGRLSVLRGEIARSSARWSRRPRRRSSRRSGSRSSRRPSRRPRRPPGPRARSAAPGGPSGPRSHPRRPGVGFGGSSSVSSRTPAHPASTSRISAITAADDQQHPGDPRAVEHRLAARRPRAPRPARARARPARRPVRAGSSTGSDLGRSGSSTSARRRCSGRPGPPPAIRRGRGVAARELFLGLRGVEGVIGRLLRPRTAGRG